MVNEAFENMTLCLCWWIHLWKLSRHTLLDRFLCQTFLSSWGQKTRCWYMNSNYCCCHKEGEALKPHSVWSEYFYRHHWSGNITLLAESLLKTLFCCQRYTYTDFQESGRAAICQTSHGWECCLYCAAWERFEWIPFWGVIQILIHLSLYNILKWQMYTSISL